MFNLLPVEGHPSIVVQLHSGNLADELFKGGVFRHPERGGVIDDGIFLDSNRRRGFLHHGCVQAQGGSGKGDPSYLQPLLRHGLVDVAGKGGEAQAGEFEDVVAGQGWDVEPAFGVCDHPFQHRAVLYRQQQDPGLDYGRTGLFLHHRPGYAAVHLPPALEAKQQKQYGGGFFHKMTKIAVPGQNINPLRCSQEFLYL